MARIHVCPLRLVDSELARTGAADVISLLALRHAVPTFRSVAPERRLHVPVSDIVTATPDHLLAGVADIDSILRFVQAWDRQAPLLIHCYAGVSRSTAAAYMALCALDPSRSEIEHADALRSVSPTATPNAHLIALADAALGRSGRMIEAIAAIGRGVDCFEGVPFALEVPDPIVPGLVVADAHLSGIG